MSLLSKKLRDAYRNYFDSNKSRYILNVSSDNKFINFFYLLRLEFYKIVFIGMNFEGDKISKSPEKTEPGSSRQELR